MLKKDRMQRYDDKEQIIEEAMAWDDSKAGFQHMQKWYKKKSGMSHQRLTTVSTKYTALYAAQQPTKPMFSLETSIAQQFEVADDPLTNDEIRTAAKRMKSGKVGRRRGQAGSDGTRSNNGPVQMKGHWTPHASRSWQVYVYISS
jgi:hypothetical protein